MQIQSNPASENSLPLSSAQMQSAPPDAPRIERCEFEALLERAMQILSARTKNASASHA